MNQTMQKADLSCPLPAARSRRPEVNVIPATKRSVESGGQIKKQRSLRVAAYCRVSTGDESQQTSYTTQRKFYTELITSKPGWTLAGIYADEAISGTSRAKRKQFNIMMEDAMNGRIDYIVTKSISRFARNTVDTLNCVRQLRQLSPPVGIYFEKENIDTLDATGELILTILSALAQDESRSISDNIRWSLQKKFQRGEAIVNLDRFLGYDKGPNGEWVINPDQAEIVRYIFDRFVCGANSNRIAKELNEMGKKTVRGCVWRADAVLRILRNEKYVGDCESQKTITKNFLTHESTKNNGEAPRYYVENHHVGIIERLTWDKVQAMLHESGTQSAKKEDKPKKRRGATASPFSNLTCGSLLDGKPCGARLVRMCYNNVVTGYKDHRCVEAEGLELADYKEHYYYSYPVWRCSRNAKGVYARADDPLVKEMDGSCSSGSTHECALEQSFMEMLYRVKRDYESNGENSEIAARFREACERVDRQTGKNSFCRERLETLEMQIKELEENLNQTLGKQVEALRHAALKKDELLRQSYEDGAIAFDDIEVDLVNGRTSTNLGSSWGAGMAMGLTAGISGTGEEGSEATIYASLAADLRTRLDELKKERDILESEQGATSAMRRNYEFFLRCLTELPEKNDAGMKMNVNGLDVEGSMFRDMDGKAKPGIRSGVKSGHIRVTEEKIAVLPDYLRFEKGIYIAFIKSGEVDGDTVTYTTNFGVQLKSTGNSRNLSSFLGFRRANDDGTIELLDEKWKVRGKGVCYSRRKVGEKRKMLGRKTE